MPEFPKLTATLLIAIFTGGFLIIGATHWWPHYASLRLGITLGFVLLSVIAFRKSYWNWAIALFLLGVFFNPFFYLSLSRDVWELLDIVAIIPLALFAFRVSNSYDKGVRFEQYASTLFPPADFDIKDRTRDISKFSKRHVASDTHPDFVFQNKKTGEIFAVECKWRARWIGGKVGEPGLGWDLNQARRYHAFSVDKKMPVWICFGIGGRPEKPHEVYFLPLEELRWPFLKQSFVRGGKIAWEPI